MPTGVYLRTQSHKINTGKSSKGRTPWNRGKKGIQVGWMKGKKMSEETKQKISSTNKGRPTWNKGKKMSEEFRRKISEVSKGRSVSEVTRRKLSEVQRGAKCHLWKGGITPINNQIRMSLEYRLWREAVFVRDNYTCIWGGKEHGNRLNADHIKPFSLFPELRFSIDNGRTLCVECHRKTDTYGGKKSK